MKWSWTIGRLAGVELRIHATFLILLAWFALAYYRASGSAGGAVAGVLFVLALFASVVLHELGHAMAARRFGVATRDITLLPIGGVARLESMPEKPKQELVIALAGPAVTAAIALVLFVVIRLAGFSPVVRQDTLARGSLAGFLAELMWVNVTLLVFNLLPAFPMDGGRLFRGLLGLRMDYARATDVAARVGRVFAFVFALIGLFYNPFLMLIGLFIWISAAAESAELHQRSALHGVTVDRLMIHDIRTLAPTDTLNDALHHVLTGFQHDFPVVDGERVVGILTRADLLAGLAANGANAGVAGSMEVSFQAASPNEPVVDALARLRECRCRTLPVVSGQRLCGLLTMDNVAEYVTIDAVLKAPPGSRRGELGRVARAR